MANWQYDRSITGIRLLVALAREQGLSARAVLAGTGIEEAHFQDPEALASAEQELRLVSNMLALLGNPPGLGIQAGQRFHFTAYGSLGFALMSCPTLRDALDTGLHYIQLTFAFSRLSVQQQGRDTCIMMDTSEVPTHLRRFVIERDCAAVLRLQRDLYDQNGFFSRLELPFAGDGAEDSYQAFFAVVPEFGASETRITLNPALLDVPLPQANELTLAAAREQCEQLLNKRGCRSGLAAQVRQYLARHAGEMPTMFQVAEAFNMIPRTLRRRLLQQGASFAELRDEVRQALAEEYLGASTMSVQQIALRLGYSDSSGFINAYRRWYGTTPHAHKRAD